VDLSGEAGGLLNVTRAFGISLGIASASTVLAWRLSAMGDAGGSTVNVAPATMLTASREVVVFLIFYALAAAAASAPQRHRR
jgi:hypothetical protein